MPEESKMTAPTSDGADFELPQNYIIEFSGPVRKSYSVAA